MSTDYLTDLPIRIGELDPLRDTGVSIEEDENGCTLSLGNANLHACSESKYSPVAFSRYGDSDPFFLLQLIENQFGVEVVSEHDDEYDEMMEEAERRSNEAKFCPSCSSADVASILYGTPAMSKGMQRVLDSKQIAIGGCCQEIGAPEWICNECGHGWG